MGHVRFSNFVLVMGRSCQKISVDFDIISYDEDPAIYMRCLRLISELAWQLYQFNPNCHDRESLRLRLSHLHGMVNDLLRPLPKCVKNASLKSVNQTAKRSDDDENFLF